MFLVFLKLNDPFLTQDKIGSIDSIKLEIFYNNEKSTYLLFLCFLFQVFNLHLIQICGKRLFVGLFSLWIKFIK